MGTFGKLIVDDFECYTVERPWRNNQEDVSCIPCGKYIIEKSFYNHGGYEAYEILDVPNRTEIKIHIGNVMTNVKGCIAVGDGLGCLMDYWSVINSRKTFIKFMNAMDGRARDQIVITDWSRIG